MKVLFLDQYGESGGAQRCLLDLLPIFRERGWTPIVAAPGGGDLLEQAARFGEVELLKLPELRSTQKSIGDWLRFVREAPGVTSSLVRIVEKHRPELVYINGPRLIPALALAKTAAPCVFHSHHFITQTAVRHSVGVGLYRLNARVIANCRFVAGQWLGREVHVVYNGVENGAFSPRTRLLRVGFVGRIAPEKGVEVFLEAVRWLPSEPELKFKVIGAPLFSGADFEVRMKARAGNVEFPGWLEDPFHHIDLLVVPSTGPEATTRVILEAWAAGVPVIASMVGGIGEIVEDNITGFLIEPGHADALAQKIQKVVSLPELRLHEITMRARQVYEQRFTRMRYANAIADLLARFAGR